VGFGSCATPMIVISSCGVNGPENGSWLRRVDIWRADCGFRSTKAKSSVTQPEKVHFLGFRFGTNSGPNVEVLISAKTKVKLNARILELTPRRWGSSLRACMEGLNKYFQGWIAYFRICTEAGADEFRRYDAHARRRLRAIVICQKKRPRFL
jgi:RNA-directed DNA polymerase